MKKLLLELLLAGAVFTGCNALPVECRIEAKPKKLEIGEACRITVISSHKYDSIQDTARKQDISTINKIIELTKNNDDTTDFTEKEAEFLPIFDVLKRITQSNPEVDLDIISTSGTNYLIQRLGSDWDGLCDFPLLLVKNGNLNLEILIHEFCHATDKHLSKWKYITSHAHRCKAESVAYAGTQYVADYLCKQYGLRDAAWDLWCDAGIMGCDADMLIKKYKTFEELYSDCTQHTVGKVISQILLDKFKGNVQKTYFFLRENNDEAVYSAVSEHLKTKNYADALEQAILLQELRLRK